MGREWGFRRLADAIEAIEATNVEIRDVRVPVESARNGLEAEIDLRIPVEEDVQHSVAESVAESIAESVEGETANGTGRVASNDPTSDESIEESTHESIDESIDGIDVDSVIDLTHSDGSQFDSRSDADTEPVGAVEDRQADDPEGTDRQIPCLAHNCEEVFDSEHGMKIHHAKVHGLSEAAEDTPAYRDPVALREVYAAYDSFPEMTEALDVDVAPQTVRRNMIKHGIHQPHVDDGSNGDEDSDTEPDGTVNLEGNGQSATEADGTESGEPAVSTNGGPDTTSEPAADQSAVPERTTELPGDVTIPDVKRAVLSAETLYEVQTALDVDRETAREILQTLNLLELVHGRVATKRQREELKAEIDERIANRSAGT